MSAVQQIVRCHQSPRFTLFQSDLEWLKVDLSQGFLANFGVNGEASGFLFVRSEMFDGCTYTMIL